MVCYIYDGSFEGLLTAVYQWYYSKEKADRIVPRKNLQQGLLDRHIEICTDFEKAEKVYNSIKNKISSQTLEKVYHVYLSNDRDAAVKILEYIRLGFKIGSKIDLYLADEKVMEIHRISRRVEFERHRMLGFVRFSLVEGNVYYAPIKPDNNIIPLIAPHFAKRFSDQDWIIHDIGRNIAAVYNRVRWVMVDDVPEISPELERNEIRYRKLWKNFFDNIAIKERTNPRLQRNLMPIRYWRFMTEKSE